MINPQLEKIFNILKQIKPDQAFIAKSKAQISITPQESEKMRIFSFEGLGLNTAIALSAFSLLFILGTASYVGNKPSTLTRDLNTDILASEVTQIDFQIEIKEAAYFAESAEQIAYALDQISR
ncbi:MAG: hypothetical protein COU06_02855 [Candidatus Harrisonbacteria bacterium CG10_big_fil_rev_8_21_14_0_10_38_8]|uniref:Uncharacterized protein n=1 Tax=Candidatus Harrisonbacteria bacterium CG10_big_fil_rev_8_21_14_0_10_38_8 TaxID=1974582 RepID=A0A2M6WJF6_9BACT|nr:MAG: hypothetical protein COU06_02855 [Candidatus Harrisonbacteria bacterium CG10_big_fil_rev_8_21_14_0_10_38_8]